MFLKSFFLTGVRQNDQVIANMVRIDKIIRKTTTIMVTFEECGKAPLGITEIRDRKIITSMTWYQHIFGLVAYKGHIL